MEILCSPQLVTSLSSVQGTLTIDELAGGNVHKRGDIGASTKMGEIKRDHTGGCKGICMCLDCVLFRTNAERSFEFSKRQLNEADEVVRGLVTEICSLRRVLEKFNGNRCSDCSQVYQDELIKAACERASLSEKVATLLTKQMYMDLDAHCKLPVARVEFSDCIDQRIILSLLETNPREKS
ncbi:hypothetical protein FCM35_KLT18076 [Carex littledalei]|uniref:Uncharacterized protein n=1 Tax=Carex littledalei TaxID=544730 RepID=A0A833RNC4_9POAL|nr:hypothetical protein FCM35_KLT18076 [Carex littledalei]